MPTIKMYPEEPGVFLIVYEGNPLTVYDKDYSDIENIKICIKQNATDADDRFLEKYYKDPDTMIATGDVILDESKHTFKMVKAETDVIPASSSIKYRFYIGVKVEGLTKYLWLRVDKEQVLEIEEDGIKV